MIRSGCLVGFDASPGIRPKEVVETFRMRETVFASRPSPTSRPSSPGGVVSVRTCLGERGENEESGGVVP